MVMHKWHGGVVVAMIRREDNAGPKGQGVGTNDLVLAVRLVASLGADCTALVEKCCVHMHQSMGMELVAIGVTADPDADVPFGAVTHIHAIGRSR